MTPLPAFEAFRAAILEEERNRDRAFRSGHVRGETTGRRYRYVGPPAKPPSERFILELWLDLVGERARARANVWLSPLRSTQQAPDEESTGTILARLTATTAILALVDAEALAARLGLAFASRGGA